MKMVPNYIATSLLIYASYSVGYDGGEVNRVPASLTKAHPEITFRPCFFQNLPSKVSLEDLIERTLCNDPKVRTSWAAAQVQAAEVEIRKAAYLPRLDGSIGMLRNDIKVDYERGHNTHKSGHQQRQTNRLDLRWLLYDFGHRNAALRSAQHLFTAATAEHDVQLQDSVVSAAQTYFQAAAAERHALISDEVARRAEENLKAVKARYVGGVATLSDYLQAQTTFSRSNTQRLRHAGASRTETGVIAIRIGLPPDTQFSFDESFQLPDFQFFSAVEELMQQARLDHPTIVGARANLAAAEASAEQSRLAGWPKLSLTSSLSQVSNDQSPVFDGDHKQRERSIGVQLSIPLFEGYERRSVVRKAKARVEAQIGSLQHAELQIGLAIWRNYQTFTTESKGFALTLELVNQARQSMTVAQGRYESGVGGITDLIHTLEIYALAQEQHIEGWKRWQIARINLAANIGRLPY